MADYTLRQLEYFVAVAEAGSITKAAAAVHLSQSAMSTALTDLEGASACSCWYVITRRASP